MATSDVPVPLMERVSLRAELDHLEDRLVREYALLVPEAVVRACVQDAVGAIGVARVHHFVPVLAERIARRELDLTATRPNGNAT